jgi:hypothetical protein
MVQYHDREWSLPVHDDRKHFEFLVLGAETLKKTFVLEPLANCISNPTGRACTYDLPWSWHLLPGTGQ